MISMFLFSKSRNNNSIFFPFDADIANLFSKAVIPLNAETTILRFIFSFCFLIIVDTCLMLTASAMEDPPNFNNFFSTVF